MNSFDNLNKIVGETEYKQKSFNYSRIIKAFILTILVSTILYYYLQNDDLTRKLVFTLMFVFIVVDELIPSYKYK